MRISPAIRFASLVLMVFANLGAASAQQPAPAAQQQAEPIYHLTMVGGSITAVNYQHRSGSTMIDFQGTPLLPRASGKAKVESKQGSLVITAEFKDFELAQKFWAEYLTHVLWAITPEGKPSNLGEVVLNGTKSKLNASMPPQSFGLIVSAEPYFAVSQPSNVVVLENIVRADTAGTIEQVKANYELLERGLYVYDVSRKSHGFPSMDSKVPLEVYDARNAVQIAQAAGAEKYASDASSKAQTSLSNAENLLSSKGDTKQMIAAARDAVQTARRRAANHAEVQGRRTAGAGTGGRGCPGNTGQSRSRCGQSRNRRKKRGGLRRSRSCRRNETLRPKRKPAPRRSNKSRPHCKSRKKQRRRLPRRKQRSSNSAPRCSSNSFACFPPRIRRAV